MSTTKFSQLVALIVQVIGSLGAATYVQSTLGAHSNVTTILVWGVAIVNGLLAIGHALLPSIIPAPLTPPSGPSSAKSLGTKAAALVAVMLLLTAAAHAQSVTSSGPSKAVPAATTTTTTPAPAQTSNGFAASSDALAVDYKGAWSAGTLVSESFDFLDFGATKANHLYVVGNEFLAPTPGFSLYTGGVKLEPNLARVLSKTNVAPGSFGAFFDASIGSGIPSTGGSHIAWLAGGGVKYQITSALTWQSLEVQYGGIGASRVAAISTGLSFIFGK